MAKKQNKANKCIKIYSNLYPLDLLVCTTSYLYENKDSFLFFSTIDELREANEEKAKKIDITYSCDAFTGLAVYLPKKLRVILIVVSDELLEDFYSQVDVIAHEAVHYSDAQFDYCMAYSQHYDEANEPYAYLVGWCVASVMDALKYFNKQLQQNES